jgi:hypothetical protein
LNQKEVRVLGIMPGIVSNYKRKEISYEKMDVCFSSWIGFFNG